MLIQRRQATRSSDLISKLESKYGGTGAGAGASAGARKTMKGTALPRVTVSC